MPNCQQDLHMVRSDTRSIAISAAPDDVYAYVADPRSLPQWAVGFCRSIRHDENRGWLATTSTGEIPIRLECDARARTIDFHFIPVEGLKLAAYSRIVPNGNGAEYIFTQFQVKGLPAELFEAQVHALTEELVVLRGVIHARANCRPSFVQEDQ
jgi:hypothetical protein